MGAKGTRKRKLTVHILRDKLGLKPSKELIETLKKQNEIKNKIFKAIKDEAKTVPEIAKETGLDMTAVFWYLMTFYRHGLVEEVDKTDEGYFKYKLKR